MIYMDRIERKFAFVLAAAQRARQLQGGALPLVEATSRKPTRVAMEEVMAGVVPIELPPVPGTEQEEDSKPRNK